MDLEDVYRRVDLLIESHGSRTAFARAIGLSPVYIGDVALRRKEPGPAILKAIGIEKVVSYREVEVE